MNIKDNLLNLVTREYKLDLNGVHGLSHWKRVEKFGLFLAVSTKADPVVISHFAYLHDSQRQDDMEDIHHGKRAAEFVWNLHEAHEIQLTLSQFKQLQFACCHHNERMMFEIDDVTIQTCFDADRLDLWRIGIEPNPAYLYTDIAKMSETIELARCKSYG